MNDNITKKAVVVIGLGNTLLSDEGIGVHLIRQLKKKQSQFPDVEFIDAGAAGMNLLHLIANRKKAVIIDCAKMGEKAGTIKRFTADEVVSLKQLIHFSLHEIDILQVLNLSKQLGECPDETVFFGVEPQSLNSGQYLSDTLSAEIGFYVSTICAELHS